MASKASKTSRKKSSGTGKGGAKSSAASAGGAVNRSEQGQADQAPASGAAPTDDDQGRILSDDELRKVKTGLAKRELKRYRNLLLAKRAEIVGAVESLESGARSNDEPISYEHMADTGTASYEQEFARGLAESERRLLREIDEALARIEKGTYGVCVTSGKFIGRARLEAKPWARHSIEVARQREQRGLDSG